MSNPIVLTKGSRINLAKQAPQLKRLRLELRWKPNITDSGAKFDLDCSVFGLKYDANGDPKLYGKGADYMVFYNNTVSADGAVQHLGDNRSGESDANKPAETIVVDIAKINRELNEYSFIVTIDEATARGQNFGQVPASSIRLVDDETDDVVASYDLEEDFSTETAVQFGSLYRRDDGAWSFKAVGQGYNLGLDAFVEGYGGEVA